MPVRTAFRWRRGLHQGLFVSIFERLAVTDDLVKLLSRFALSVSLYGSAEQQPTKARYEPAERALTEEELRLLMAAPGEEKRRKPGGVEE